MSKVHSASPSSHAPSTSQQTGVYAEGSSTSLGTPGLQQHAPAPFPKAAYASADHFSSSSNQARDGHHGFSAFYRGSRAEASQAGGEPSLQTRGLQAELSPAAAGDCDSAVPPRQGMGEAQGSGAGQPQSPRATISSDTSGGADTPKTLRLKAMAAQTERLQQVPTVLALLIVMSAKKYEVLAVVGCTAVLIQALHACSAAMRQLMFVRQILRRAFEARLR